MGVCMEIVTHSKIKAFESCPNMFRYGYVDCLKSKVLTQRDQPLERGTWFHALLETHYRGEHSWEDTHDALTEKFGELFEEEQDALGDLPGEMQRLMDSYLWHYGAKVDDPTHGWTVHGTEEKLECELPDGSTFRMKYDLLVEDERGLWLADHKTHLTLPNTAYRLLDKASTLYVWCARQNGIPVNGFIWNYVVPKAPTKPKLVDKGARLSKVKIITDFPTVVRAIQEYELDPEPYKPWLYELKSQRWAGPDALQTSPFFRRDVLQFEDDHIERTIRSVQRTVDRLRNYQYDEDTERFVGRGCDWCAYRDLCVTELTAGPDSAQARNIRRQQYKVVDPFAYYGEQK